MTFSDYDYGGLSIAADAGMYKSAKELMGRLTTGNDLADLGLSFIPGAGTVMTGYDTVRNGVNGFNDLFHGRFKSALGNFGSMAFNGGVTALNAMTLGMGGKAVGWAGKMLGRGAKALGMTNKAKQLGRFAGAARKFDSRVAGNIAKRLGGRAGKAFATARLMNPNAAKAMNYAGGGVGGWLIRHPFVASAAMQMGPQSALTNMTEGAQGMQKDIARNVAAEGVGNAVNRFGYSSPQSMRSMRGNYLY